MVCAVARDPSGEADLDSDARFEQLDLHAALGSTVFTMRIGTLARRLDTTPHAIRYYEGHGLLPRVARTDNGYRE